MRRVMPILSALWLAALAPPALASGAWTTYLRAFSYRDLLAEQDTVWCATGEAGLLVFSKPLGRFSSINRVPSGLASNSLTALARDRSGRLWVGTRGLGVSRIARGATTWALVNRFDGLPSDTITTLTAYGDTVWIGTTGGIAFWNGRQVVGALPDGVNPSPFASNEITGLVQRGDSLWVATRQGAYVSRISTGLIAWSDANDNLPATLGWAALATDGVSLFGLTIGGTILRRSFASGPWLIVGSGLGTGYRLKAAGASLLAATALGIHRWNGSGWTTLDNTLTSDGDDRTTFALGEDPAGRVWAANASGLRGQPAGGGTWSLDAPPGPPGNAILNLFAAGGRVYVATYDQGLGRFDGTQWKLWPKGGCTQCDTTFLDPRFPFALVGDRRGHKWFGMWQIAVEELDDSTNPPQVIHHTYSPPPKDLRTNSWASAVDSVKGGLWFGMDTNCFGCTGRAPLGLLYYGVDGSDSLNLRQDSLPGMAGSKVHGLTVDKGGRVWVGYTEGGIQYFNWPTPPATEFTFHLVEDSENFDIQGLAARGDTIWAMTTREVRAYRRFDGTFYDVSVLLPSVPSGLPLNPLAIGLDGTVYIGTTAGVRVRHPDGRIEDFTTANSPIADNDVPAVRVDPVTGAVWIGTAAGLNRYDPAYVAPPAPPVPELAFTLYPNPLPMSALGISLRITGTASAYRGTILDLGGRRLRTFTGVPNRSLIWDGRDDDGELVPPGLYFVKVEAGGRSGMKRIVVVR